MNRSFRGGESRMPGAVMQQRQGRSLGAVMKDKEDDLALFLEMRKHEKEKEKERNSLLLQSSYDLDPPLGSKPGSSPLFKIASTPRKAPADDFLNSENDKNDYEWLITPPGTPLFPSLDMESNKPIVGQIATPKTRPTALKSRLANPSTELVSRGNTVTRQPMSPSGVTTSGAGSRRPSSSGGPVSSASRPVTSRPATPTARPTLPGTTRTSRPATPTSRSSVPSKAAAPSTKPSAATARSSTPTARPSLTASKSTSRSATPLRRPLTPSSTPSSSVAPPARSSSVSKSAPSARSFSVTRSAPAAKSSSVTKSAPAAGSSSVSKSALPVSKNPVLPRGTSPTVKSRPWKPSEMPGFSLDAPPNLRTSMPQRPASASRGRPGVPSPRSSSVEAPVNGRPRRQSCSPLRGRAPNGNVHHSGSSVPVSSRSHSNGSSDCVSPVVIGTKMVERVINMRRLAPPKDDHHQRSGLNNSGKSSSSPDSSGFGRTLSKKSLDMALRHMDIRRSNPGSLRPLMTNIPASSMYSVRSGSTKSRTASILDSPLGTCSNASSEQSVSNNVHCLNGSEIDEVGSERGLSSPASQRGSRLPGREKAGRRTL